MASACWDRSVPNGEMPGGILPIPVTKTAIGKSQLTFIVQFHVANDYTFDIWVRLEDGKGFPIIPNEKIEAHKSNTWAWDHGIKCEGGLFWQATANGLFGEVMGYQ